MVPILSLHYKVDKINNASFMRKEDIIKTLSINTFCSRLFFHSLDTQLAKH